MINTSNIDSSNISSATGTTTSNKTLGKDDFLKMLLAQLKNQDPLNPVNGTDFAAQLAQFTSLEQMTNMSTQLQNMSSAQNASTEAQSISLIGKQVTTSAGNNFAVNADTTALTYSLDKDATQVTVSIYDANGTLVNTLNFGSVPGRSGPSCASFARRSRNTDLSLGCKSVTLSSHTPRASAGRSKPWSRRLASAAHSAWLNSMAAGPLLKRGGQQQARFLPIPFHRPIGHTERGSDLLVIQSCEVAHLHDLYHPGIHFGEIA